MPNKNTIIWDFEGTLARRQGGWKKVLAEVLVEQRLAPNITPEEVSPFFTGVWPWNFPEHPHAHITTAEEWWLDIEERILIRGYTQLGYPASQAEQLARLVHQKYIDPKGWFVYEDAKSTLAQLQQHGWRQVILSNHVPELAKIATALGFGPYIETVFTSALIGYEKPHPQAFLHALERLSDAQTVWMVGDSIEMDIFGAEQVGIPAILVREQDARAKHSCLHLSSLPTFLAEEIGKRCNLSG